MSKKTLHLNAGWNMDALGFCLWNIGQKPSAFGTDTDFLRYAYDAGFRIFDAAESYGKGGAEEVAGEAFRDCRDSVKLGSKVSPALLDPDDVYGSVIRACDESLRRLQTDYVDMYTLHSPENSEDWAEILDAFLDLKEDGKIKNFGVSYFDAEDLSEWLTLDGAEQTAVCENYFTLAYRKDETDLLPLCRKKGIPLISYPRLAMYEKVFQDSVLKRIAADRGATPAQIALAWLFSHAGVGAFVTPSSHAEIRAYVDSLKITLKSDELQTLDARFPRPPKTVIRRERRASLQQTPLPPLRGTDSLSKH